MRSTPAPPAENDRSSFLADDVLFIDLRLGCLDCSSRVASAAWHVRSTKRLPSRLSTEAAKSSQQPSCRSAVTVKHVSSPCSCSSLYLQHSINTPYHDYTQKIPLNAIVIYDVNTLSRWRVTVLLSEDSVQLVAVWRDDEADELPDLQEGHDDRHDKDFEPGPCVQHLRGYLYTTASAAHTGREREREKEAHSGCYRSLHPELKFSVLRRSQVEVITGAVWNSTRAQDSGGTNTQR